MKTRLSTVVCGLIGIWLWFCLAQPVFADQDPVDPGEADTVIVNGPIVVPGPPWPDSIGIDIYYWGDEDVAGYSFGLDIEGEVPGGDSLDDYISASFFDHSGAETPSIWIPIPTLIEYDENRLLFGSLDFAGTSAWNPPIGKLGTIWYRIDPDMPFGTVASLDSSFISPGGSFIASVVTDEGTISITPQFLSSRESGTPTITFGEGLCGDFNGDGEINISDATFVIQYIFAAGPPPVPLVVADADCSGQVNIADVVYLIQYIFAGGPPPCDPDNDGSPDC